MKMVLMVSSEPGQFWLLVKAVCVVLMTAWTNWPGSKFQTPINTKCLINMVMSNCSQSPPRFPPCDSSHTFLAQTSLQQHFSTKCENKNELKASSAAASPNISKASAHESAV